MEKLLKKMCSLFDEGKVITLSKLVLGSEKLDQIRNFIILLFLAQKNRVTLWQEENSDEVFITINGGQQ